MKKPNTQSGFTLLEISIVLGIMALLIGGILGGKEMIRNSQIRAVAGEAQNFTQAIGAFRDKYMALPGDFAAGVTNWNSCNGDGNGRITDQTTGTAAEQFCAWVQLSNAKMIDGSFSGTAGTAAGSLGAWDREPGTNIPNSRLSGSGWGLITITVADIAGGSTDLPYVAGDIPPNTVLWFGLSSTTGLNNLQSPSLTTTEALEMDIKLDDGMPKTGKVVAQAGNGCYNASSIYDLTLSKVCTLVFKTGF